ncbi:MAG: hypothetical protein KAI17_08640 [Thiotrichaceae bacterium]|nr:hypothetical protein [Thiotrichaceae bacterium]
MIYKGYRGALEKLPGCPQTPTYRLVIKEKLTANGLSSSKLVDRNGFLLTNPDSTGKENSAKSQRVEFRVRIDAESKISRIIDAGNEVKHQ